MSGAQALLGGPWLLRPRPEQGVSEDARKLSALFDDALAFGHSVSLAERYHGAVAALRDAYEGALGPGWDGYGARPVDPFSYIHALSFVSALPTTVPLPEVAVDPDGEIEFEWYRWPRWLLTVSVGRTGSLSYAGLFGRNKVHGVEQFSEGLPDAIVQNLRRLLGGRAPLAEPGAG